MGAISQLESLKVRRELDERLDILDREQQTALHLFLLEAASYKSTPLVHFTHSGCDPDDHIVKINCLLQRLVVGVEQDQHHFIKALDLLETIANKVPATMDWNLMYQYINLIRYMIYDDVPLYLLEDYVNLYGEKAKIEQIRDMVQDPVASEKFLSDVKHLPSPTKKDIVRLIKLGF